MELKAKNRIYCAGGFGINIGIRIAKESDICYIDTSSANRTDGISEDKLYHISDLKGAGQDRRRVHTEIVKHLPKIIEKFPPAEFNIVIFSSSGGSGSVIGPLIVRDLIGKGETVVAITVGETETGRYLENTIATLKTLEAISINQGVPLLVCYNQNEKDVTLSTIDDETLFVIDALLELASQQYSDIDVTDVHNWINYNNVCSAPVQLTALSVFDHRKPAATVMEPVSTISLYQSREDYGIVGNPHFSKAGYAKSGMEVQSNQLHFIASHVLMGDYFRELVERKAIQDQKFSNYRSRKSFVSKQDDDVTGDDLVF